MAWRRSPDFHPSVHIPTLRCKIGPPFSEFTIKTSGERDVLGFSVGDRENQGAWEALFDDLKARGVKEIGLWGSSGNQATLNAIGSRFATSARQCCVIHKMDNVLDYVPSTQRDAIRTRQDGGYLPFADTLPPAQDEEGDER